MEEHRETFFVQTSDKKIGNKMIKLCIIYGIEEATPKKIVSGVVFQRCLCKKNYMSLFCCNQVLCANIFFFILYFYSNLLSVLVYFFPSPILDLDDSRSIILLKS